MGSGASRKKKEKNVSEDDKNKESGDGQEPSKVKPLDERTTNYQSKTERSGGREEDKAVTKQTITDNSTPALKREYTRYVLQDGRKTVIRNVKKNKIVVMAIDFGTTYTGYAFAFFDTPEHIYTNYWEGTNIKTPTVVLLDDKQQFHSFGREAKAKYVQLISEGVHHTWYYFEHFKMKLFIHKEPLDVNLELVDMTGKTMMAIDIFAAVIAYMKKHFLEKVHGEHKAILLKAEDVHFILTVPAIWSDLSKGFMRKAAVKAGIPDGALSLALEPEAASIYCKQVMEMTAGKRYIVADLGGGTADFTCHEVNPDMTLKELQKPSGGDYGGTTVDNAFRSILNKLFGADVINEFKMESTGAYYELLDRFEVKKRYFDGTDKITLQFPYNLFELYEQRTLESINNTLESSPYKDRIVFKRDKMIITLELARDMFDEAVNKIVDKTNELLGAVSNIEAVVMVGGFSESPYLNNIMKTKFEGKTIYQTAVQVLSPNEPSSAVIKGAVINGHDPKAIDSRVCKYTYGIGRMMWFDDHVHPTSKRIVVDGTPYCDDLFNKHIEIGQTVRLGDDFEEHDYYPVTDYMKQGVLMVYASTKRNPQFIDEPECQLVGLIRIDLTGGNANAKVLVKLVFGGTELIVEALEEDTGKMTVGPVDFLG